MSNDVKVRFRSFLPGAGYDGSGRPVQGKTNVRGVIDVTSYTSVGESLLASDLGLSNIDDLTLTHVNAAASPGGRGGREVRYNQGTAEFYIDPAGSGTHTITFDAFGDGAHDSELL